MDNNTKEIKNQAWLYKETETTPKDENDLSKGYEYKVTKTSLVQEVIKVTKEGDHCTSTTETNYLIEDIWANLKDDVVPENGDGIGYFKNKKGNYFYWKYQMSNFNDEEDGTYVTVKMECPQPTYDDLIKMEVFEPEEIENGSYLDAEVLKEKIDKVGSDYLKYWLGVFATSAQNAESKMPLQKSKINYPKHVITSFGKESAGELKEVEEKNVPNNDLANLANLLSLF